MEQFVALVALEFFLVDMSLGGALIYPVVQRPFYKLNIHAEHFWREESLHPKTLNESYINYFDKLVKQSTY